MVTPHPPAAPTRAANAPPVPNRTALPRLTVAAPGSGHGKTTVASGLMGALRAQGLAVAGFKVGPDYIDPGYHAMATGRPGRNLDPHLCHEDQLVPLLMHGAATPTRADVAIIEGVMGLFDGQLGGEGFASTAHVARLLSSPVILVLDISSVSRTAAAIVHGLNTFQPEVRIAGVILNKAGSKRHAAEICSAMEATGVEVLGVLPRDAGVEAPSRHLGLIPAAERDQAAAGFDRLAATISDHVSLTRVMAIARDAADLTGVPWSPSEAVKPASDARPVIAVAGGRAFTFRYAETDELLRAAGCEPVVFDPLTDARLPQGTAGIYLGGGFPEVHAAELSANTEMRSELLAAVGAGVPTVAECAGLLYLCDSVDGHPMVGAVSAAARMTPRLTLSYRSVVADHDHLLALAGARVTGHEFHRTVVEPGWGFGAAWLTDDAPTGFSADPAGIGEHTLHASYLHTHWAGHPQLAQRFADAAHAAAARGHHWSAQAAAPVREQPVTHDLWHHGDRDIGAGLVDLAVNVRVASPPSWLRGKIDATTRTLAAYPDASAAVEAIAAAHNVPADHVLPTSGAAEAFTLLTRAVQPSSPLVVHPQFTEPEAALVAAGHHPQRLLLDAESHFILDPARVPATPDLVMVGNPTNPTSVLHAAAGLRSLIRRGRTVCVDEAFMDAVPGEPDSLIQPPFDGLVVVRSLTKTWGLAGLRAGYVVGHPNIITAMRQQQTPWSVSTPALAAMVACLTPDARASAAAAALEITRLRDFLVAELTALDLAVAGTPTAPFVLVDTSAWADDVPTPGWVRRELRAAGFAVRRGETFPGLDANWIRIAVRDEETTIALVGALRVIRGRRDRCVEPETG